MNKELKKNEQISLLRVICILLVVFAHSIIIYKNGWDLYETNHNSQFLNYLCSFIYLFHMPLFFSISGYLAKSTYAKTKNIQTLAFKKATRLLVPYFAVGLLYLLPIRYLAKYNGYINKPIYENILINIILGNDNGHLWFLASLFIIFLTHYLLVKYLSNKKARLLVIATLTLAGYFLPSYIGSALRNILWFHLGYILSENKAKLHFNKIIAASIFTIFAIVYFVLPSSMPFYGYCLHVLNAVVSASAILLAYILVPNRKMSAIGATIEKNSMGIYLFHSPLIYFSFAYFPDIHPVLMFVINFIAFGGLALLLTIAVRKTKLRIVLGE